MKRYLRRNLLNDLKSIGVGLVAILAAVAFALLVCQFIKVTITIVCLFLVGVLAYGLGNAILNRADDDY